MSNTYKDKNKLTATKIAEEKYSDMPIEKGRAFVVQDETYNAIDEQRARHAQERNEQFIVKSEIEDGLDEYFAELDQEVGGEIDVDVIETDPVDIEVYQIPVVHKLGEIATRR